MMQKEVSLNMLAKLEHSLADAMRIEHTKFYAVFRYYKLISFVGVRRFIARRTRKAINVS